VLAVSSTFLKEGLHASSRSIRVLALPDFVGLFFARASTAWISFTIGDFYAKRYGHAA